MFCLSESSRLDKNIYDILDLDNNSDIIKYSKDMIKKYLKTNKQKGNFWHYEVFSNKNIIDCFGSTSMLPSYCTHEMYDKLIDMSSSILNQNEFYVEYDDDYNIDEYADDYNIENELIEISHTNAQTNSVSCGITYRLNDNYNNGSHSLFVYIDVEDCIGGELVLYDEYGYKPLKTINIKSDDKSKTRCVLLNGECYFKHNPIISGRHVIISFHFPASDDE